MKNIIVLIACFYLVIGFSQNGTCVDIELFDALDDIIQIENSPNAEQEIQHIPLFKESLQLVVFPNDLVTFPKWARVKRKGIDQGFKIMLINDTQNDVNLINDGNTFIIQRQVFKDNTWQTLPSTKPLRKVYCANERATEKHIESNTYLTFVAPCINQAATLQSRFVMFTRTNGDLSPIYSNTF